VCQKFGGWRTKGDGAQIVNVSLFHEDRAEKLKTMGSILNRKMSVF
jgi:hypothetical protein